MTINFRQEFDQLHARLDTIEAKIDDHLLTHSVTRQVYTTLAKVAGLSVSVAGVLLAVWKLFT